MEYKRRFKYNSIVRRFLLPFTVVGLSACSVFNPPYLYTKPENNGDTVTGVARDALVDVQNFEGWGAAVYLSPQKIVKKDGTTYFQMVVQLTRGAKDYILIRPGPSLIMTIDGERFVYKTKKGSGPRRSVIKGSVGEKTLTESAVYEGIRVDDLRRISEAKAIDVEIIGKTQSVTAKFAEINFSAFQTLIESKGS